METLASVAATSNGSNDPPMFHAIAQDGVEEFKRTSKLYIELVQSKTVQIVILNT